jgi:hypothetical protein
VFSFKQAKDYLEQA